MSPISFQFRQFWLKTKLNCHQIEFKTTKRKEDLRLSKKKGNLKKAPACWRIKKKNSNSQYTLQDLVTEFTGKLINPRLKTETLHVEQVQEGSDPFQR